MKPILFEIFGQNIYGYGTMIAIGIISAVLTFSYRAKKKGYDEDSILNMTIAAIISGVIGGKLLYIITELKGYIDNPKLLLDFGSGFVILGAVLFGALAVYIYARRKKWEVLKVMDLAIPSVALAQGFGRIGCFFAGCCYGKPTNLRIGVVFKNSPYIHNETPIHPTQVYSSIFDFALAFFLFYYSRKDRKRGRIISLYAIIYSIGRFCVEFLRDDPRGNVAFLSTSQFISIFILIIGIVIFNESKIFKGSKELLSVENTILEADALDALKVEESIDNNNSIVSDVVASEDEETKKNDLNTQ